MKKILSILIIATLLVASFGGCTQAASPAETASPVEAAPVEAASPEEKESSEEEATPEEKISSTVTIVVPFNAGGTSDILARILAPRLSAEFGVDVIVENKPGAGGNVGADVVAHAKPDGTSLLLMDVGTLAIAPSLYELTYDPGKDLAGVSMIAFSSYIMAVNSSLPVNSVEELIAYSKEKPLNIAHSGVGSATHLTDLVVSSGMGVDWKIVAYSGGSDAIRAVVSGECDIIINGAAATKPYVLQDQLKGLAVTGDARMSDLPDVPTFSDAGLPAEHNGSWQGLLVTAGTPDSIIKQINEAIAKIVADPEIAKSIEDLGAEISVNSPAEMDAWVSENTASYAEIIKAYNITL